MKNLMALVTCLILSNVACASNDPFQIETQACVKEEVKKQFTPLSKFDFSHVSTMASNESNFDYIMILSNPETNEYVDRIFISVKDADFSNAVLTILPGFKNRLNLQNCFN